MKKYYIAPVFNQIKSIAVPCTYALFCMSELVQSSAKQLQNINFESDIFDSFKFKIQSNKQEQMLCVFDYTKETEIKQEYNIKIKFFVEFDDLNVTSDMFFNNFNMSWSAGSGFILDHSCTFVKENTFLFKEYIYFILPKDIENDFVKSVSAFQISENGYLDLKNGLTSDLIQDVRQEIREALAPMYPELKGLVIRKKIMGADNINKDDIAF